MRDFSQHGHLIVSIDDNNRCCFNLNSILDTPHFAHNSALKEEMENFRDQIICKFKEHPNICFTRTIAEFNLCVIKLYMNFISFVDSDMNLLCRKVRSLLKKYDNLVYKSDDNLNGYVIYRDLDGKLHSFNFKDNPMRMVKKIEKMVKKDYMNEFRELKRMKNI